MNLDALRAELTTDPLARGYAGMTAEQAAASLNVADRSRIRTSMSGDEVFQATVAAEFNALTVNSGKQTMWLSFCARSSIDPAGVANVAFVQFIFGAGSSTVIALNALRQESISRATELGLEHIEAGHVEEVRRG